MVTTRECLQAVLEGKQSQIVWWPRLKHWLDVNYAANTLPYECQGKELSEIYQYVNATPREVWTGIGPGRERLGVDIKEGKDVEIIQTSTSGLYYEDASSFITTKYVTPEGEMKEVRKRTEHGTSTYPVEHFLKDEKSIDVLKYILEHRTYQFDWNRYRWGERRYGNTHYPSAELWYEPYMRLVVPMMGFQNTIIWLWKHPKEMEELMEIMTRDSEKQIQAFKGTPLVELNFGSNMHENLCSPTQFKKYIIPFANRVVPQIHALGMRASAHWDGYCKHLLPLAKETGLDGLECVTPEPQGDVTLEDMKKYITDRGMYLRDGIPGLLFTKYHSVEELEAFTKRILDILGKSGRLMLGVSDLVPANGEIERVKIVSEIVKKHNDENFR